MALTPEDVVNKRFQPTKFREGYDQDEVDDFLDEVVVELRRLNQENEELRQRLVANDARISELQRSGAQAPAAAAPPAFDQQPSAPSPVAPSPVAAAPAPMPAPPVPADAPAASAPGSALAYANPTLDGSMDPSNTNNLLQLARRLHEEHVREGVEKRDALIAEGQATAARVVSEAEAQGRAQLSGLEQERTTLEHRIDELRTFEREYRQKLKGYIEGQLRELDATSSSVSAAPVPTPVGAPVSAVGQASAPTAPAQNFGSPVAPPPANYPGFAGN
jgi:DivIVA domain-containing protein